MLMKILNWIGTILWFVFISFGFYQIIFGNEIIIGAVSITVAMVISVDKRITKLEEKIKIKGIKNG